MGSSPRMRGTRSLRSTTAVSSGIIPAYAGNTQLFVHVCELHGDHPRVCGEHAVSSWLIGSSLGSSPRMRGTLFRSRSNSQRGGIIPAYAGNTSSSCTVMSSTKDHPRVCGEHRKSPRFGPRQAGSSPRMRGTLAFGHDLLTAPGIIPAYAGNTGG